MTLIVSRVEFLKT